MSVTIDDVRTRWSILEADVSDALLTILLAEATTTIVASARLWGSKYDLALTHLTAHLAFESVASGNTPTATFGSNVSESFVQRSVSRGGLNNIPAEYVRFTTTVPGMAFAQLATAIATSRFPMVSRG